MKKLVKLIFTTSIFLLLLVPEHAFAATVSSALTYEASAASDQDDMTVWIHPTDLSKSMIIGSDKDSGNIFVYDINGTTLQTISSGGQPGNIDLRYNFSLGGNNTDIVVYNERSSNTLHVYSVNASTRQLTRVDSGSISTSSNYGVCLYKSPSSNKLYAFKTSKGGDIEQYELSDNGNGQVRGVKVRSFDVGSQTEACVADDENRLVYMAEEGKSGPGAIWKYGAEPSDGAGRTLVDDSNGNLNADVEGVTIYHTGSGTGYIIASSQGASEFDIYQRLSPHAYVATFKVSGASSTDGIDVSNVSFDGNFPQGMFLAHDGGAGIKAVPWQTIANSHGLTIDTSWNPRGNAPPPTPLPLPGDTDQDGDVDIFDYNNLVSNFGQIYPQADFNLSGLVDIFDYNTLVSNFGKKA